jgi:prepilin-type N-terminal cleavage/methylation domain-containing protein
MPQRTSTTRFRRQAGFTLIEVAIASVIVSVAVLAMLGAQQAVHQQTAATQELDLGLSLANEIREITLAMPAHDPITGAMTFGPESNETSVAHFDDIDDFAGTDGAGLTISPPVDAHRQPKSELDDWSQNITVEYVDPSQINGAASATSTDLMRITVRVMHQDGEQNREVTRMRWLTRGGP